MNQTARRPFYWSTLALRLAIAALILGVAAAIGIAVLEVNLRTPDILAPVFIAVLATSVPVALAAFVGAAVALFRREGLMALSALGLSVLALLPFALFVVLGIAAIAAM